MYPRYVDDRGLTIISDRVVHDYEIPEEKDMINRVASGFGGGALYVLKNLPSILLMCFGLVVTVLAVLFKIAAVFLRLPLALLGGGGGFSTALFYSAMDDNCDGEGG